MPNVSSAFFLLTALTAILYMIMYLMLFVSAIRLRYTQPKVKRTSVVPGGNLGMWLVSGLAILGLLFAIILRRFEFGRRRGERRRFGAQGRRRARLHRVAGGG